MSFLFTKKKDFTTVAFLFGTLLSSFFFNDYVNATSTSETPFIISDVSPVNPLDPSITVEPVPAPPDYKIKLPQKKETTIKKIAPKNNDKPYSENKNQTVINSNDEKISKSKLKYIKKIPPYSDKMVRIILTSNLNDNSGGSSDNQYVTTCTGEILSNLSGVLTYGMKK